MSVSLQEGREKVANAPDSSETGQNARNARAEVLNFERSEVVHFFRELLDFLRDFSEAHPRSRPTSPLSHRARNTGYRASARATGEPGLYSSYLDAQGEVRGPVRAPVQGRANGPRSSQEGPALGPEVIGAPGTSVAGEIFRRPRSLAGSMPRPEELNMTPVQVDDPSLVAGVPAGKVPVVEEPEAVAVERKGWKRLRVRAFVSKM